MAAALKTQFIEAVRLMPDGIQDFLTTELPKAPDISTPADVDAANIATGVLSKFLLDVFRPFAGFTPIEMLARIGQHNSVLESAMIAGLEYLGDQADAENQARDFEIIEPEADAAYLPGSLRLIAKLNNSPALQMAVEIEGAAPVSLASDNGQDFYGFVRLEEVGSYTATFTALFEDERTQTASVSFAMATEAQPGGNPPQQPDGSDLNAFESAVQILKAAIAKAMKYGDAAAEEIAGTVVAAGRQVVRVGDTVIDTLYGTPSTAYTAARDKVNAAIDALEGWISGDRSITRTRAMTLDDLFMTKLADMNAAGQSYNAAVIATYWQNNQHPAGGYTSCPESLSGAAQAMNDKYGPGTVTI